jgi:hypothetical protein
MNKIGEDILTGWQGVGHYQLILVNFQRLSSGPFYPVNPVNPVHDPKTKTWMTDMRAIEPTRPIRHLEWFHTAHSLRILAGEPV